MRFLCDITQIQDEKKTEMQHLEASQAKLLAHGDYLIIL